METLFWILLGIAVWCYLGYPALMGARALLRARPTPPARSGPLPRATVVLAVRNGSALLERRLRNLLEQDYPPERLEVVVVCNGCTDDSEAVARRVAKREPRVRVLVSPAEEGKAGALNRGVAAAEGEVVVFADARQLFDPRAVRTLVAEMRDPRVGAASGRLVVARADRPAVRGVGWYWGLETMLRLAESRTGSVVGATGAIYAIRTELFEHLPPRLILDDVYLPLRIARRGFRVVLTTAACAFDVPAGGQAAEYHRKRRTMVGNLQLLRLDPALLSPRRNPLFFRFLSHKVLRLLCPLCFLGLTALGLLLPGWLFQGTAALGIGLGLLGLLGLSTRFPRLAVPAAFLLVQVAVLAALLRFRADAMDVWVPSPAEGGAAGGAGVAGVHPSAA